MSQVITQNMERREFEDSWKEAFKDSEIIPSDNVWTNIELGLEKEKAVILNRRLVRYQWLAAASVIFSIGVGISVFVSNEHSLPQQLATTHQEQISNPSSSEEQVKSSDPAKSLAAGTVLRQETQNANLPGDKTAAQRDRDGVSDVAKRKNNSLTTPGDAVGLANVVGEKTSEMLAARNDNAVGNLMPANPNADESMLGNQSVKGKEAVYGPSPLSSAQLVDVKIAGLPLAKAEVDPVTEMLARLKEREKQIAISEEKEKDNKKTGENLWTSVGFAAGSFSAVNSGASSSLATAPTATAYASSIVDKETKASGVTYSVGVNLGTKLADRWVLQGGVNLLNQTSEYTQQALLQNQDFTKFRTASINELDKLALGDVSAQNAISTAPYDVNNNVRYLSIPLQAGYLIVNRAFGVQMNAGVATDLFLQNTISATSDGEKVDAAKAGIGENTAFRPLNFSGLMGTEVSYKFWKHYRVALNPGVRYPFSSIYKSDNYRASRLTFDVGLRFRYIFH